MGIKKAGENNKDYELKEDIRKVIKILRPHHLSYNQTRQVFKEIRRGLGTRYERTNIQIIRHLDKEEVKYLINNAYKSTSEHGLILKTLFFTGLRVNELVNVQVEDINWPTNELLVTHAKGSKQRIVPLFNFLKQELLTHLQGRERGYIFESNRNTKYTTRRIQQIVKKEAERAGITKRISPHTFRHSIATFMLEKGVPLDQIQKFLGHENIQTTQIYAKTSTKQLKDNLRLLEERGEL